MESLMIMLGASMSTDQILQKLQDELNNYLADPSEEAKNHIAAVCALYLSHIKCGGSIDNAMKMINDFKNFEKMEKLFKTNDKN